MQEKEKMLSVKSNLEEYKNLLLNKLKDSLEIGELKLEAEQYHHRDETLITGVIWHVVAVMSKILRRILNDGPLHDFLSNIIEANREDIDDEED